MRAYSSGVEHPAHNRTVLGSIPSGPINGMLEKWLNSPAFHAGIQGFESPTCQKLTDNFLLYVSFLLGFEREDDAERVAKMKSSSSA